MMMHQKFCKGFLTGILTTVLLIALIGGSTYLLESKGFIAQSAEVGKSSSLNSSLLASPKVVRKIETIETLIQKYYMNPVKNTQIADGLYRGMMYGLDDPYAAYYTKEEFEELMQSTDGVYCGVGATVQQNAQTGLVTIVKPFANGPAAKAGILAGDILYQIDGEDITGKDLSTIVGKMKGKKGSQVKLTIIRDRQKEPITCVVTRDTIEVPTIEAKMLDGQIGYIAVTEFDTITAKQFRAAIDTLEKKGQKGLVIDLRDNGGGVYDTAIDMLDRLLPKELLVYIKEKDGTKKEEYAKTNQKFTKPMVVLMNGASASASEIFAGALQDYQAATIVGTQSFGKGIVQSIIPLYDGSAMKLTVSKYYTPKGRCIHGIGITPDRKVEQSKTGDRQLKVAIQTLQEKLKNQ